MQIHRSKTRNHKKKKKKSPLVLV